MSNRVGPDLTGVALERALDALAARQAVVANNIANADTPGFQANQVSFERELDTALTRARQQGGPAEEQAASVHATPWRVLRSPGPARPDGNNVSIEREVAQLGRTGTLYQAVTRLVGKRLSMLREAISEGSRQ
jgi:flagellar basal-body rod protein FlgB